MSAPVRIARAKTEGLAYCDDCSGLRSGATRERVRIHVAASGHTAHFVIKDKTTYRPVAEEKP